MILAVVIYLGASGPVAASDGVDVFGTMAGCRDFLDRSAVVFDLQRLLVARQTGQRVTVLAFCHEAGDAM